MAVDHTAVEQAKQFLKDRILATAAAKRVTLSAAEVAMLTYSEPDATPEERDFASEVDAQIGEQAYERKVTSLIRAAYKHDVAQGMNSEWMAHMRALQPEDYYVLVMA